MAVDPNVFEHDCVGPEAPKKGGRSEEPFSAQTRSGAQRDGDD